jgi:hypothetical protein
VAEVQLDVGFFYFLDTVERLELFFGQGIYYLVDYFSYTGFKVKPVDAYLWAYLLSVLNNTSPSTSLIFFVDLN